MIRACMFDLDGTLANTLPTIAHCGNTALKHFGYPAILAERYQYMIGNGADMLIRRMLDFSIEEYTEETVKQVRKVYDQAYETDPLYLTEPYPGISKMLNWCRQQELPCAVLSNKPHDMTLRVVAGLFPEGQFVKVQGQEPRFEKKPSPQGAFYLAGQLGVLPEECLYVGDSDVDMKTGKAAGMITAGVLWGFRTEAELRENGADFIAAKPEALIEIMQKDRSI